MRKMYYLMLMLLLVSSASLNAQVVIGVDRNPSPGTILELVSDDRALLLPFVTTGERKSLQTAGLIVYNTETEKIEFCCNNGQWKTLMKDGGIAVNISKAIITSSPDAVTGVKISDDPSSTTFSKESVLELESSTLALCVPVVEVDEMESKVQKGLLAFAIDEGSSSIGKLFFCENGINWDRR